LLVTTIEILGVSSNFDYDSNIEVAFLADRSNGRTYATVLRLSSVTCLCVLEQKLLLTAYEASHIGN